MEELEIFLAKKMKFCRLQLNWTLKKVAEELGVSLQHIQRYENGAANISGSLLYKLSKLFNMKVSDFFDGFSDNKNDASSECFRILLVEDNSNDVFFFQKALEDYKQKVELYIINDGAKASLFFSIPSDVFMPDIIFLDLHLPNIPGLDLLKSLKWNSVWKNVPVIILTTSLTDDDITKAYQLQSSGFLHKSFSFDDFKNNFHQTLKYWGETVLLSTRKVKNLDYKSINS